MAVRQIPNLPAAVFVSPAAQVEIVQDGTTYRASVGQISDASIVFKVASDTTSTVPYFPLFAKIPFGVATEAYTSDPNYNYIPSEGRLSAMRVEATQGLVFNASVSTLDYTFPTGDNATSCGPLTVESIITVPTGSEWIIL